jgi:hypothetical protein
MIPYTVAAQLATAAEITSPRDGDALQGQVQIAGTADAPDFASAELSFAYASDVAGTWFVIQTIAARIQDGVLGQWDTTTISDGEYILRLRVNTLTGAYTDATVPVQVRNYTSVSVAVSTAAVTRSPSVPVPTAMRLIQSETLVPARLSTPTALPPDPAAASSLEIYRGFLQGALVIGGLFLTGTAIFARRRS